MCSPAFSWNINKNGKIFHKDNLQSHSGLSEHYKLPDDFVIKAEYNWWEGFNPANFKILSRPFEISNAMIKNSERLVHSFFHSKDTTFAWVKRNFNDTRIADKFVETYSAKEIYSFLNKYKKEIDTSSLAHIVKFTLEQEIASTAFYNAIDKFSVSQLFHICLFSNNGKVRQSAFEAGFLRFTPEQLVKLTLSSKDRDISKRAFNAGRENFSSTELVDIAINGNYDKIDETAFRQGEKLFKEKELAKITMSAKSFPVRNRAQKIYSLIYPRMDY